ncbi:MAG: aldolase/citrate lyase family protein [Bryobacterales bacterium]|nr:aldolase/citrate lyase family protein [Bryobacterales bacterium]
MRTNRTKKRLRAGETVIGCCIQQFGSPEVVRLLSAAGFDFVFLDGEHGPFDMETLHAMIRACLERDVTPLVRVGELQYTLVARALDAGAQGIIFPRVESKALLAEAIRWTRFPPEGVRGYGLALPQLEYQSHSFAEIIEHVNANTQVVVQFETRTAIERREELLATPGVDVALIGPADLSISLGVPGDFEHPRLVEAALALMESAERLGVAPGIQVRSPALAKQWLERGMRFVGCGSEHGLLWEKARQTAAELKALAGLRRS